MKQVQQPKISGADQILCSQKFESLIHDSFAPKAFSPEPQMNDRISFLQTPNDQILLKFHNESKQNSAARRSSTVSREATLEDVYMTQRAQQAIISGKKKKHKKTMEQNYLNQINTEINQINKCMALQNAASNYFQGSEQIEIKKVLKNTQKKQKKNSLNGLEAETYLKMLSMSQMEKQSPSINFKSKLKDSTNMAYHTKLKSKSQSGGLSLKTSANSVKIRDNSTSLSGNSSLPPTETKNSKRQSIRMNSIVADHSQSSTQNKSKMKAILRKSAISPQTPNTLQEPSAKAIPTSSKVKISTKFNKPSNHNKEKSVGEKSKIQMLSNTQSKKNMFTNKNGFPIQVPNEKQPTAFSPTNKSPILRKESFSQKSGNQIKERPSLAQNIEVFAIQERDAKWQSNQVYGMKETEQSVQKKHPNLSNIGSVILHSQQQFQISPMVQYYNQLTNQGGNNDNSFNKHQNSQLFQPSQLKSHKEHILSVSNELENTTFSVNMRQKFNNVCTQEEIRSNKPQNKKVASVLSKERIEEGQIKNNNQMADNAKNKSDNKSIFDYDIIKNFRSASPVQKRDINSSEKQEEFQQHIDSNQSIQKKLLHIKRTSLSPPTNQFFNIPNQSNQASQQEIQKIVVRMFPKHSPKVSPDTKVIAQTYKVQHVNGNLGGSVSASNVINNTNVNLHNLQKITDKKNPQISQNQYIAETAIQNNQDILRLSRPISNEIIKTFKLVKTKFLSPEIKVREGMSPENQNLNSQQRKSSNSPHFSNGSGSKSNSNRNKALKPPQQKNPAQTTSKVKTQSQLSSTAQYQNIQNNGSARVLFIKPQAEVVLNRLGSGSTKQKGQTTSIKDSIMKNNQTNSSKHQLKKAPITTASIALTKNAQSVFSQDQIVVLQKNQQLFKKSTLQKSSINAQYATKKNQARESQESDCQYAFALNGEQVQQVKHMGGRKKSSEVVYQAEVDIDQIPVVEVVENISNQRHKDFKHSLQTDKQNIKSMVQNKHQQDLFDGSNKFIEQSEKKQKNKKSTIIGDQIYQESQKKKPVLNQITENSDTFTTPITKGNMSLKSSVLSQFANMNKFETCSDKEQLQYNKDLQKLLKMFRLHFKQFNQAPPTTCEFYRIGRVLGKGAFGKVNFAMHKLSEQLVAIKSMSKETLQSEDDLRRRTKLEMGILQQGNHPNVVRLFDTFETQKHICFVMELCSGGDLFSYIKKRRRLKEDVARFFFRQIVEGLAYIHNAKLVVHRDIKLENILLDATGQVKICDFGVSRQLKSEKQVMHEQCGTPAYIAPEILRDQGYNGFKTDMWSAGVCLYAMLIGSVPFKAATMTALQELILKGQYDLKFQTSANSNKLNNPKAASTILSEDVQDLIKKLLNIDPTKRFSAVQALEHPWLRDAPTEFDVFTDKEKTLIQKEYMRLNLKKSTHVKDSAHTNGRSSRHASFSQIQETEQALFTEHNLETRNGEDEEPQQQNNEERSYILAPFNSIKSMFIENTQEEKKEKSISNEPFKWPEEILNMIVPRRVVKFLRKCREKNRIYEQNNNADLDNGVYNEFVNEQEKEEGAMLKKESEESDEKKSPKLSKNSDQEKADSDGEDLMKSSSSSDSLQKSFKETELSSDEDKADRQVKQTHQDWQNKKESEFLNMMEEDKLAVIKHDEEEQMRQYDKRTPPCVPGVSQNHRLPQQSSSIGQSAVAHKVMAYQQKEFHINQSVVQQIEQMNVIPKQYLLSELEYGSQQNTDKKLTSKQQESEAPNRQNRKMNYVTALYYLLVKRKELLQIQIKQKQP